MLVFDFLIWGFVDVTCGLFGVCHYIAVFQFTYHVTILAYNSDACVDLTVDVDYYFCSFPAFTETKILKVLLNATLPEERESLNTHFLLFLLYLVTLVPWITKQSFV